MHFIKTCTQKQSTPSYVRIKIGGAWLATGKRRKWAIKGRIVALGGVVVSVLATGPKVAGSNPAEDDGF
jgi:hypothetical protein